jgi:hypothetical protein
MLRRALFLLLPALLLLTIPAFAPALPWDNPGFGGLSGNYVNTSNGGNASVMRDGRSYVFTNENGSNARFVFDGPGQLRIVEGEWDPRTRVFVQGRDRFGRQVLRFESTGRPGYWVQTN